MASTRSSARSATFRSLATQKRRSSRNSGWNTAIRIDDLIFVEPELTAEFFERLGFQFPALSSDERSKKPLGVLRRSQKVSSFDQSAQFRGRDQRDVSTFAPMNDDRFPRVDCFIEQRLQVRPGLRVGSLRRHGDTYRQRVQDIPLRGRLPIGDERLNLPGTAFANKFHTIAGGTHDDFRVDPATAAVGEANVTLLAKKLDDVE